MLRYMQGDITGISEIIQQVLNHKENAEPAHAH